MNKKDFKAKLKEENSKIEIEMSEAIKSTQIVKQDTFVSESKKMNFLKLSIYFTCFVFIALCFSSLFVKKSDEKIGLTSYILEVNPSICITTDGSDNVINICALNDDANAIVLDNRFNNYTSLSFDECVSNLVNVMKMKGYFENFAETDSKINIYAFSDSNEIQYQKLSHFEQVIKNKMVEFGFADLPFDEHIEKHRIGMDKFKQMVGFEEDYRTLDDMQEYFRHRDVRFSLPPQ